MSTTENHDILDDIYEWLEGSVEYDGVERLSECVEFTDPSDGQVYEIVVRPID